MSRELALVECLEDYYFSGESRRVGYYTSGATCRDARQSIKATERRDKECLRESYVACRCNWQRLVSLAGDR